MHPDYQREETRRKPQILVNTDQNLTPGPANKFDKVDSHNDSNSEESDDLIDTREQLNLTSENRIKIMDILEGFVSGWSNHSCDFRHKVLTLIFLGRSHQKSSSNRWGDVACRDHLNWIGSTEKSILFHQRRPEQSKWVLKFNTHYFTRCFRSLVESWILNSLTMR